MDLKMSRYVPGSGAASGRLQRLLVRSRPRFWLYTAGPVVVGVAYGATSPAQLVTPLTVALFLYFLIPANLYLYGVNDVFDAELDAVNPKKKSPADGGGGSPADRGEASPVDVGGGSGADGNRASPVDVGGGSGADGNRASPAGGGDASPELSYDGDGGEAVAVVASGLLGAALLAVVPSAAVPWFAGFLVLAAVYSVPPLRLKTTPLADSVSNGLYVLPGAGAYVALAGSTPPLAALAGAWLWTMAMHTFSAVPDIEPDRAAGITTTATLLGERRTLAYCGVVWTLAALSFGVLDPRAGALLAVYPLLVVAIDAADVAVERAYWWYPAVNTLVGMVMTLAGLWGLLHG